MRYHVRFANGKTPSRAFTQKRAALRSARAGLLQFGGSAVVSTESRLTHLNRPDRVVEKDFVRMYRLAGPAVLGSIECWWLDPNAYVEF